jgi:hypothetical protein
MHDQLTVLTARAPCRRDGTISIVKQCLILAAVAVAPVVTVAGSYQ